MTYEFSEDYALQQDKQDTLKSFRDEFEIPVWDGKKVIYFTGNSLGLMPKRTRDVVNKQLDKWGNEAVEGHFTGEDQWFNIHKTTKKGFAYLVGALESEVVLMNSLTANLHFLLASFYQPKEKRYKIMIENKAFPSDQYVVESQTAFHGYNPKDAVIELQPDNGLLISTERILNTIEEHKDELALLLLSGVNYYSGQKFDMATITKAAKKHGIKVGWDLAHAAGNVELNLHEWGVDFASWCTYKYLNSGPGAPSGIFVHEKHEFDTQLPRFAGWWGYDQATRFKMEPGFVPMKGADGWQVSNGPILAMAAVQPAVDLFLKAKKDALFQKRDHLTGYLEWLIQLILKENNISYAHIITPKYKSQRGSQLSLEITKNGRGLFQHFMDKGIVTDWREPGVIRFAPVPLYNTYTEMYQTAEEMDTFFKTSNPI